MQATLSHYRIVEEIGAGGMGVVYRAHDQHLDCDVALKVLPPGELTDDAARKRFRKEALALSKVHHPNIAVVHDFDTQDGTDFLVEELIPGLSLNEMLTSGPLPEREVVNLGAQLCEGLAAAHQQGVIHRDLKPGNIRVTPDARLKILDFGLAKVIGKPAPAGDTQPTASLTETQAVSGTFPYMAPEQLLNEKLDARSDIWAVGCVLYEMATGQRPFLGYGPALTDGILHQPPPAPSKLNHKVAPGLEAIILKCLEKDPALRYASARDIAVDLHRLGASSVTKALAPQKRARLTKIAITAALLLVISAFAAWYWNYRHKAVGPASPRSVAVLSFRNVSGDPSLDWLGNGLVEMLTTNLSQVKGMDVLSTEQVWRMLKHKGQQDTTKLTAEMALDVARDAGADTCVTGSLMKLGPSRLRVDLHLQDTRSGKILFSDKVESEDINGIFAMVDAVTARLAERSLPLAQVPSITPAIEQVTTSNVEALRHYQAGTDYANRLRMDKAAREYEEAVRLDPQFASAYFGLYRTYNTLGDTAKRLEALHRLEPLQARLPRLEQLRFQVRRSEEFSDVPAVIQARETILQEFPRDGGNRIGLAWRLLVLQQPDRAVALVREGVALTPTDVLVVSQAPYIYAMVGNEGAALEACDRYGALAGKNEPNVWDTRGDVLYQFQRDEEAVAEQRRALELDPQWAKPNAKLAIYYSDQGKPGLAAEEWRHYQDEATGVYRVDMPMLESVLSQLQGNPEAALEKYKSAIIPLEHAAESSMAYDALAAYSVLSLLLGNQSSATDFVRRQQLQGQELLLVSFLEAANGNASASNTALRRFTEATHGAPTFVINQQRHLNSALIALRRSDPDAASRVLPQLEMLPQSVPVSMLFRFAVLVRGRTYFLVKDYAAAERDFRNLARWMRNLANHRARREAMPLIEHLCYFYLGQIYEATDRRDDAIREYHSFLFHYTHSRSRMPEIAQARAALIRLGEH